MNLFVSVLILPAAVHCHGVITTPAVRDNTKLGCAWCQGGQETCADVQQCAPPTPCWGAPSATTLDPGMFNHLKDLKAPDGSFWIDQTGGAGHKKPFWCPGSVQPIRFYIYADHNGVFRWESQIAEAGEETELGFKNFTDWQSVNVDPFTKYYNEDGITVVSGSNCTTPGKEGAWTPQTPHCRDNTFAEVNLQIPHNMPAGNTVIRWLWYGAMKTNQEYVKGPEHSLFLNCFDVEVGTPEDCGCTGGNLNTCKESCKTETGIWDGSFDKFMGNDDFCSHCGKFGVPDCSFICAGGNDGGSGAGCEASVCSSGQYSFHEDGWHISVTAAQAAGKAPYRALAYLPFCNGKQISQCVQEPFSFSISFRSDDLMGWGAYVKFLFWTDSGNIIGLLPPGSSAAKGNKSFRLLAFPQDDLPNTWLGEMVIEDGQWYDAKVSFQSGAVTLTVGKFTWTNPNFGVDIGGDGNGPQLGVYSFDYGGQRTSDSFLLTIGSIEGPAGSDDRHECEATCLENCDSGVDPVPTPPTPPTPPAPTPGKGPGNCCWGAPDDTCESVSDCHLDAWCGSSEDTCKNCAGKWCPVDPVPSPVPTPVPSPLPPSPVPLPVPLPVPPTPAPVPSPSGCPGGSLDACIDLCPADVSADIFQACLRSCAKRCPHLSII